MNVAIVGAGYVGLVTGLCLAERGHRVMCVDSDDARVARLAQGSLPFYERGLQQLLQQHLRTRFFPTTDTARAVQDSEITMICVGTPLIGGAISLRFVAEAATAVGAALKNHDAYHVVVVKSTVVPGTTETLVRATLEHASGKVAGVDFGLGMNPEFLREAEAVDDFQKPDRIVLGGIDQRSVDTMAWLYLRLRERYGCEYDAEHRRNDQIRLKRAARVADLLSNEIGNCCSAVPGVDVLDVLGAVHLEQANQSDNGGRSASDAGYHQLPCGGVRLEAAAFQKMCAR